MLVEETGSCAMGDVGQTSASSIAPAARSLEFTKRRSLRTKEAKSFCVCLHAAAAEKHTAPERREGERWLEK